MIQAAQQVAQINQQILKNQAQPQPQARDQAALMLAQAEQQDTATKAKAQQFTEVHKTAELELKKEALQVQKAQIIHQGVLADKKHKGDMEKLITTAGLDSMIEAMSQGHKAQTDHSLQHQKTLTAIATMPPPKPPGAKTT